MRKRIRLSILLVGLALSLVALANRSAIQSIVYGRGREVKGIAGKPAAEFPTGTTTLDGKPISLTALRGRVVLLHFWTFACSNCEHMVPHYTQWHTKYAAQGLQILGAHSPETDDEADVSKLRAYVTKSKIPWSIIHDNEYHLWRRYRIDAWPTVVLIDRAGVVQATFIGDDQASQIEAAFQKLLAEEIK